MRRAFPISRFKVGALNPWEKRKEKKRKETADPID
jgi:hypothetical protein